MLAARTRWRVDDVSALLAAVATDIWNLDSAIEPDQVFGPAGPVIRGLSLEAFCAAPLQAFSKAVALCRYEAPPIEILQLVPVTAGEAELVRSEGLPALLACIRQHKPDLFDLARPPMCGAVQ